MYNKILSSIKKERPDLIWYGEKDKEKFSILWS